MGVKRPKAAGGYHQGGWDGAPTFNVATAGRQVPFGRPLDDPRLYFNRELSWLDYVWRLLARAMDPRNPLLERVRFLASAASFLDEFFSKRFGGLRRQQLANISASGPDGFTAREQLSLIRQAAVPLYGSLSATWDADLRPALAEAGIRILPDYDALSRLQAAKLRSHFEQHVLPVLTPLAVDPGHPFPFVSNLSVSLAVTLRHPRRGTRHFARVKIPPQRGRWVSVDGIVVALTEVVKHNLDNLFRGMIITGAHAFRVTRNADLRHNEEEAEDLLTRISDHLRRRRFAPVVRLEVEHSMPKVVRQLLMRHLEIAGEGLYEGAALIDPSDCLAAAELGQPDYGQYPAHKAVIPAPFACPQDIFEAIRSEDILVHHPYECFRATVLRFVEEAAQDPRVLVIKQTLYRTTQDSEMLAALIRAAEAGKQVAVHVEAKARYDEQRNLAWGQRLEESGVNVTYGLSRLKTHAKVTLVVREEADGTSTYCHIGTGNYNSESAATHSDVGIFTCDSDIGADITNLFHFLSGYASQQAYRKILVAPAGMRQAFVNMIRHEAQYGGAGRIIAAMNELDDAAIIQELYRAAAAGVRIELMVRGPCRLRPGLSGYSDSIRVVSIVGRFTENLRVFSFAAGGRPRVFIGSADWRRYHLDQRVEVAVPILSPAIRARLDRFLAMAVEDAHRGWDLGADGGYTHRGGP